MKKPTVWLNPNRMLIETGHKTFDRQCRAILTGQQIGDCVTSAYVRPRSEVKCNGFTFEVGHLQDRDLEFVGTEACSPALREHIVALTANDSILLYKFFHHSPRRAIVDGYVATRSDHCLLKVVTGPNYLSSLVITEAARHVSDNADSVAFARGLYLNAPSLPPHSR
jgi:hypothetical protein